MASQLAHSLVDLPVHLALVVVPGAASGGGRLRRGLQAALQLHELGLLGLQLAGDAHEGLLLAEFRSLGLLRLVVSDLLLASLDLHAELLLVLDNLGGLHVQLGQLLAHVIHELPEHQLGVFHALIIQPNRDRNTILRRFHMGATPLLCHVARP